MAFEIPNITIMYPIACSPTDGLTKFAVKSPHANPCSKPLNTHNMAMGSIFLSRRMSGWILYLSFVRSRHQSTCLSRTTFQTSSIDRHAPGLAADSCSSIKAVVISCCKECTGFTKNISIVPKLDTTKKKRNKLTLDQPNTCRVNEVARFPITELD